MIIESSKKLDTELTVRELMKYDVPEIVIVENEDDNQDRLAACSREVGRLFDLIIVLAPVDATDKDQLQVQSLYSCLEHEGIVRCFVYSVIMLPLTLTGSLMRFRR